MVNNDKRMHTVCKNSDLADNCGVRQVELLQFKFYIPLEQLFKAEAASDIGIII